MQPLRIRIDRVVDFGAVVSLVGVDTETAEQVTIHVDHRPFAVFWRACTEAGLPQPVEYEADRLLLRLDMTPTNEGERVRLVERDTSQMATASGDRHHAQEIEQ